MTFNQKNLTRCSGANSEHTQPNPLIFFLDRSLGKFAIADCLRDAGALVKVHDDQFPIDTKDSEWLSYVGAKNWVVLTKDKMIRHRQLELLAMKQAGVKVFVLTNGNLSGPRMAAIFVKALPAMRKFINKNDQPFIAHITSQGKVSLIT